ncbi:hypothetical protein [Roseomonas chloroacetimidivorans]|uniref:hypothetical protein n=1 Tax=Roseomonas chloroacetimidivorans TaxID=1766656 RepID=UPI003C73506B
MILDEARKLREEAAMCLRVADQISLLSDQEILKDMARRCLEQAERIEGSYKVPGQAPPRKAVGQGEAPEAGSGVNLRPAAR